MENLTSQDGIDHKVLLIKYIQHVYGAEGTDFIRGGIHSGVDFTPEEWAELEALALIEWQAAEREAFVNKAMEYAHPTR